MNLRASFCDPFSRDIIELGPIDKDEVIQKFESIYWQDYLRRMQSAKESEIHFSPSLEIQNADTRHGLDISAVGEPDNFEFYIFYKRPKKVKGFLRFRDTIDENYLTDKTGQTRQDVIDCLRALINDDTDFIANKIGK